MRRVWRILTTVAGIAAIALVVGFITFADMATRTPPATVERADGIVVLTGGGPRIRGAAQLLRRKKAGRMLISGVNRIVTKSDIKRIAKVTESTMGCCIDIGYIAQNTRGNAREARDWARQHGFKSLIVVTESFHMPRSMSELASVLPEVELIPYPVLTKRFHNKPWWRNTQTTLVLIREYLKYIPSATHLAIERVRRSASGTTDQANNQSAPSNLQ